VLVCAGAGASHWLLRHSASPGSIQGHIFAVLQVAQAERAKLYVPWRTSARLLAQLSATAASFDAKAASTCKKISRGNM
jgi:hypothetical protein